jgi:tetratricopeptide (TPR) repeat protein
LDGLSIKDRQELHDGIAASIKMHPTEKLAVELWYHLALGTNRTLVADSIRNLSAQARGPTQIERLRRTYEELLEGWPLDGSSHRLELEIAHLDLLCRIGEYSRAVEIAQSALTKAPDDGIRQRLVNQMARALLTLAQPEEALELLSNAPRHDVLPETVVLKAWAHYFLGNHSAVISECRAIMDVLPPDDQSYSSIIDVYTNSLQMLGQTATYREVLQAAIESAAESDKSPSVAVYEYRLGIFEFYQGRFALAEECFLRALSIFEAHGDRLGIVRSLNSLAAVAAETGRVSTAAENLRAALELARRLGQTETVSYLVANLAHMMALRGQYREALDHANEAIRLSEASKLDSNACQNRIIRAGILSTLGQGSFLHEELANLRDRYKGHPFDGQILLIWSDLALQRGDLNQASEWLTEAKAIFESHSVEDELVSHLVLSARLLEAQGRTSDAEVLASKAIARAEDLHLFPQGLQARVLLAGLLVHTRVEQAQRLALDAARSAAEAGLAEGEWQAYRALARSAAASGDLTGALEAYSRAIGVLRDLVNAIPEEYQGAYLEQAERMALFEELQRIRGALEVQ